MTRKALLEQVKSRLGEAFGDRLEGVVLYGSEARGDAGRDSDVDVLVLLMEPPREPEDSWTCINTLYPLILESGRPIHAEPVAAAAYHAAEFPLYRHAAMEGVLL